jgi:O-antigen/teichoic acid export membrane protein
MSIKRNTFWNLVGTGSPILLGILTIPYLLKQIGLESFGILTIVWALIGYFSIFDFGLGRALTQQVSVARSSHQFSNLPSLVKTGLLLTAATGVIGGGILAALASELSHNWLNISPRLQESTTYSLIIAAIGIPLTTVTTGMRGIIEAYEDFRTISILRMCLGAANFGLPAISVMFLGESLPLLVSSLIAARLAVLLAHARLVHLRMPTGWLSAQVDIANISKLTTYGAWMTLANVVSSLSSIADKFFISAVVGASVVAYYTVPYDMLARVLILPSALTAVLFPRLSALIITDWKAASNLYRKCRKIVAIILMPIAFLILIGSKYGLTIWLGRDFADHSWPIVSVMSLGILMNGVAYVPYAAIQALGNARISAYINLSLLVIYLPMLYLSLKHFGLIGAAIAWTIKSGFDLIALTVYVKRKKL